MLNEFSEYETINIENRDKSSGYVLTDEDGNEYELTLNEDGTLTIEVTPAEE